MDRLVIAGILVGVAFAFTVLCLFAGGSLYICAFLMSPGAAISVYCFHAGALSDSFFPLTLAINTLIYTVVFGLLLWTLRPLLWKSD